MKTVAAADVVVVGGGISGCASAYYLAKAGKKVILVEKGLVAGEASGRNGGFTMQIGRHPQVMPLARLALRLWPTLEEEIGYPTEWERSGGLGVALNDYEWEIIQEATPRMQELGLDCTLVDRATCLELVPPLTPVVLGGIYSPGDGHANPVVATKTIARGAMDRGAEVWQETEVTGIVVTDGQVTAVDTSRGRITTEWAVLAGGPWASFLGELVGLNLPVVPWRIQILITEPQPPLFEPYLFGNHLYLRQAQAGNIHCGGPGPPREESGLKFDKAVTHTNLQHIARLLAELLPKASDALVLRSWAGVIEILADGPIVGVAKEPRGVAVACGFYGNGFGLGPGTGKVVSELILGQTPSADVSRLGLERYAAGYVPSDPELRELHEAWFAQPDRRRETGAWAVTGVRPSGRG